MNCKSCGGKGFIDSWHGGANTWTRSIQQCSKRCNLTCYSEEVQKRLNDPTRDTGKDVMFAQPSQSVAQLPNHGLRLVK